MYVCMYVWIYIPHFLIYSNTLKWRFSETITVLIPYDDIPVCLASCLESNPRPRFCGAASKRDSSVFDGQLFNEDVHSEFTVPGIEPRISEHYFVVSDALAQSATDPPIYGMAIKWSII